MLLGKMSVSNRYIADAEKLPGQLSDRYRALIVAARQMFVHLETRGIDEEVESAFQRLASTGFDGIARMLRCLPLPTLDAGRTTAVLTKMEVEVLRAIERSADSKAAALVLGKSSHTIDWHVKAIMKKLNVKSRREAIGFARENGLIG
jgi:DNA-binding CsgD family transcriptional regulator